MQMALANHGLKAVYAIAIAWVLVAALKPQPSAQPQAVAVQPSPVQPAPVAPSPQQIDFYDPALAAVAQQVKAMDESNRAGWALFCSQTRGGIGYPVESQQVCKVLEAIQ